MRERDTNEALCSIAIAERALRTPDEIAVASESENLSAVDFDQRVNAFAHVLSQIPRQPTFLPMLVGTNVNSVIAYHAAIRSRTPVALIDSQVNPTYLDSMLERLGAPGAIVITHAGDSSKARNNVSPFFVDDAKEKNFNVPSVNHTELACVLFSSGSTGQSKGIVYDWSAFDYMWAEEHRLHKDDANKNLRVGRTASVAFSAGAAMMMSAALNHQLHLIDPHRSADDIISFVNEQGITNLALSSSFAERVYDTRTQPLTFTSVNEFMTYGEGVNWDQIGKIRELTQNRARISADYGASEGLGSSCYFHIGILDPVKTGRVPIGLSHSVNNLVFLPLKDEPEIHEVIMKKTFARGYFKDDELTAQKFFTDSDGSVSYRSQDLVRVNRDGTVTFVGRGDDLVKINGRVVEPAESESALRAIPGIKNVVVLPHTNDNGDNILVAHLVLDHDSTVTPQLIYQHLLEMLSSHLVPSRLVKHDDIPLIATGKIDRQYLQTREWPRWRDPPFSEVATDHERFALEKLQVVLGDPELHMHEDVFGAGMDSLAALEFGEIAREFGFDGITPATFLDHRTAKSLANRLLTSQGQQKTSVVTINGNGSKIPIYAFPGGGGTALSFRELSLELGVDQPIIVIEPHGLHGTEAFDDSIEKMAQRAAAQIRERQMDGEIHLLGYSIGGFLATATGIILDAQERIVRVVALDTHRLADEINLPPWLLNAFLVTKELRRQWNTLTKGMSKRFSNGEPEMPDIASQAQANSYRAFYWHIESLLPRYRLPAPLAFPVTLLYCPSYPSRFRSWWRRNPLFATLEVAGIHATMMDRENLPALTRKISQVFSSRSS